MPDIAAADGAFPEAAHQFLAAQIAPALVDVTLVAAFVDDDGLAVCVPPFSGVLGGSTLRAIQERWEQIGPVPREAHERLEGGLRRIEDAVRKAEDAQWRRSNPEALARARGTVEQIRAALASLEDQLAKARQRGDARGIQQAEEAIAARQSWLAEAERTLAELSG